MKALPLLAMGEVIAGFLNTASHVQSPEDDNCSNCLAATPCRKSRASQRATRGVVWTRIMQLLEAIVDCLPDQVADRNGVLTQKTDFAQMLFIQPNIHQARAHGVKLACLYTKDGTAQSDPAPP